MILARGATTLRSMEVVVDTALTDLQPTLARLRTAWNARRPGLAQRRDHLRRLRTAFARRATAPCRASTDSP